MADDNQAYKEAYYNDRQKVFGAHDWTKRQALGERELKTIGMLGALSGNPDIFKGQSGPAVVLDAGCGDKYIERAVRERGMDYIGVDIEEVNFERDPFPLADNSVDLFISLAVLEHVQPGFFLKEALRVLRPGGTIFLSTPNFQMDFKNFYNDPTHVRPYTPKGMEYTLQVMGFDRIDVFPCLRCKPAWYYQGKSRFWKAYYLLPFRGDNKWAPEFLKGHARGLFGMARKPG